MPAMAAAVPRDTPNWPALIQALETASNTPPKRRAEKVSVTVDKICELAFEHGLPTSVLQSIVDIVTRKTQLDQTSVTNLAKNLYPSQKIPSNIVIRIVCSLGQGAGKPSSSTQGALLRWLTIVHEIIEDPRILSKLYNVLFNHLDMISLRTPLCHLLCLITRRRHVRPFRIQQLLELVAKVGNEAPLVGLLRIYKDYYPDIIVGKPSYGRASMPPQPDAEWRERLNAIHEVANRIDTAAAASTHRVSFRVLRKAGRTGQASIVPDVHTSQANESSVTLEEIDGIEDFVARLEKIELPNQVISALQDPLLQKYLLLNPDPLALQRIELWLSRYLNDELELARDGSSHSSHFSEMLRWLRHQTSSAKEILPVLDNFLRHYILVWDGHTNLDLVLGILEYLPIQPFQSLFKNYLHPIESTMSSHNTKSFEKMITFLRNLLRRWRAQRMLMTEKDAESKNRFSVAFQALVDHAHFLILTAACSSPVTLSLNSTIISFYEIASVHDTIPAASPREHTPIIYPPIYVAYQLLFSSSISDVSRLCAILANCKRSFENLKSAVSGLYAHAYTRDFNGQLMDICNLVWRNRALNASDANAAGCLCPEPTVTALQAYLLHVDREYSLPSAFGISHNWLLCAISIALFRKLEDDAERSGTPLNERQAGPVTQRALTALEKKGGLAISYKQYRVEVLKWLEARNLGGIKDLMYSTMVNLKDNPGG